VVALSNLCSGEKCHGTIDFLIFRSPNGKGWLEEWGSPDMCCTKEMIETGVWVPFSSSISLPPSSAQLRLQRIEHIDHPSLHHRLLQADHLPDRLHPHLARPGASCFCRLSSPPQDSTLNIAIEKAGIYVIVFAICDPASADVLVEGIVESLNPCPPPFSPL
jgi:hypothetical protein